MFDCMPKREQINFRVKPEMKADLDALADFHGLTVSSYVHSVLVKQIRQEREATPEAFPAVKPQREKLAPVVARIEPAKKSEPRTIDEEGIEEIRRRLGKEVASVAKNSKRKIPFEQTTQQKKRKTR